MTDKGFINEILRKGKEAKDKVITEFSNLSVEQLNWQPEHRSMLRPPAHS
jgi:hypothetical protein